jgi:hypothetical protein
LNFYGVHKRHLWITGTENADKWELLEQRAFSAVPDRAKKEGIPRSSTHACNLVEQKEAYRIRAAATTKRLGKIRRWRRREEQGMEKEPAGEKSSVATS